MRKPNLAILVAAAALGVLAVAGPARASITSVELTTPQYTNLPCPTSIPVTAVIDGTPGQTVSATLQTDFGGVVKTVASASATLSSSGIWAGYLSGAATVQVTASGTITYAVAGYAPKSIGVSCANAPFNPNGTDLGVPTNLSLATSASACAQYFSGSQVSLCQNAIAQNRVVLTWSYDPICAAVPCDTQDGFTVQGGPSNAMTTAATPQARGVVLNDSLASDQNACFHVMAYKGSNDIGRASNAACLPLLPITLTPAQIQVAHNYYYHSNDPCTSPDSNPVGYTIGYKDTTPGGPNITVGFLNRMGFYNAPILAESGLPITENKPCNFYGDVYQSVLTFDLTKLPSHAIASATLSLGVLRGAQNSQPPSGPTDGNELSENISCAVSAGFPTQFVADSQTRSLITVPFVTALTFGEATESTLSLNLTGMVNAWLGPKGVNNGVVLSSIMMGAAPTAQSTPRNTDCMTEYDNPRLTVTFKS